MIKQQDIKIYSGNEMFKIKLQIYEDLISLFPNSGVPDFSRVIDYIKLQRNRYADILEYTKDD